MRVFARSILLPLCLIVFSVGAQADDFWWGVIAGLIYLVSASTVLDLLDLVAKDNKR